MNQYWEQHLLKNLCHTLLLKKSYLIRLVKFCVHFSDIAGLSPCLRTHPKRLRSKISIFFWILLWWLIQVHLHLIILITWVGWVFLVSRVRLIVVLNPIYNRFSENDWRRETFFFILRVRSFDPSYVPPKFKINWLINELTT